MITMISRFCITVGILLALLGNASALDWPVLRDSTYKPIGNSYAEYQCYGDPCQPYFHTGIDIMAPEDEPVYAVESGYVKAILTTSGDTHWRMVIADSANASVCDAWMYAHLDYLSMVYEAGLEVGDTVSEGQFIGRVVYFPYHDFNHLHFSRIRHGGANWFNYDDWEYSDNPLEYMDVIEDPDAPVFEDVFVDQRLAFCDNGTADYYQPGDSLTGDVDIVCKVYDFINDYDWKLTPYSVEYRIDDSEWKPGYCFTSSIGDYGGMSNIIDVLYRDDSLCDSRGDYEIRDYYITVTNADSDSLIESEDKASAWSTANYTNGDRVVYVRASDRAGNSTIDSMTVPVANYFSLSGSVTLEDSVPQSPEGVIVSVPADEVADTTDGGGSFAFASIGGGLQHVIVSRPGFVTVDTAVMMNTGRVLDVTLVPGGYVNGDANCDASVSVVDAVYVINYVFKGGPAPLPYAAGDANCDGVVNVSDAVYLINYIFKGGPPPGAC